jgi:hypothetical protein
MLDIGASVKPLGDRSSLPTPGLVLRHRHVLCRLFVCGRPVPAIEQSEIWPLPLMSASAVAGFGNRPLVALDQSGVKNVLSKCQQNTRWYTRKMVALTGMVFPACKKSGIARQIACLVGVVAENRFNYTRFRHKALTSVHENKVRAQGRARGRRGAPVRCGATDC